jgi:hypothetical protein
MIEKRSSRRHFVALGVSAGSTALAGCSSSSDDGSNSNGGGDGGSVVIAVDDQSGSGTSLIVEKASAPAEFSIDVHGEGTSGTKGPFEADSVQTTVEVPLDPPLQRNATLEVGLHNEANGQHIGENERIQYTVNSV